MRYYQPGDLVRHEFPTASPSTGAAQNADSLPEAVVVRNVTVDVAVTVTITNISTGLYRLSFTIPSDYDAGDDVTVRLTAIVDGVIGLDIPVQERLVGNDLTSAAIYITPLTVTVGLGEASDMGNLVAYLHGPMPSGPITINDALGSPVNMSAMVLTMIGRLTTNHATVFVLRSADDQLTVGGASNNQLTIVSGIDYGESAGQWELFLQNQSDSGRMLAVGGLTVFDAPELPA